MLTISNKKKIIEIPQVRFVVRATNNKKNGFKKKFWMFEMSEEGRGGGEGGEEEGGEGEGGQPF